MKLFEMLRLSLSLDIIFLFRITALPLNQRILFILKKYMFYLLDLVVSSRSVPRSVTVFNRKFYYVDIFGLASLQRVYCESYRLKSHIPRDAVVVDVGANVGQFNFFCRQYLVAKRVISIEPIPSCYELLKLNAAVPDDCINCVVANEKRNVVFYIAKESLQLSSYIHCNDRIYTRSYVTPGRKLDDIVLPLITGKIDLLKIDTEGSEYDILLSSESLLNNTNYVLIEMSLLRPSSGDMFRTGCYVEQKGFSFLALMTEANDRTPDVTGLFGKL